MKSRNGHTWVLILMGCSCIFLISSCSIFHGSNRSKQPFSFFVLGDWGRKGGSSQTLVANQMIDLSKQKHINAILTVGDNFYEDGVTGITDEHWQTSYENVYKDLTKKYPWYATLGNHDYRGSVTAQMEYHTINSNWNMPGYYYTVVKKTGDGQQVRFIILDTDPYVTDYYKDAKYKDKMVLQDTARQTRWLDSVLSVAKEDWKIVFGHHPVYCVNAKPGETAFLKQTLQPLFDKYGVQAYICGHDHLSQDNRPAESHTAYIISGGGSKTVSSAPKEPFTLFSSITPGFAACSINGDRLTFNFIDTLGQVMYQNTVDKN